MWFESTTLFCGSKIAARWTAGLIVMKGEELEAAKRLGFGEGKNLWLQIARITELTVKIKPEGGRHQKRPPDCDKIKSVIPELHNKDKLSYWRRVLRMAALCHDMGHLLFSHAAEKDLLPAGFDHETMTGEQGLLRPCTRGRRKFTGSKNPESSHFRGERFN
ncbi:MAG: HD domain-containing protein [Bacillota bacterium]|nr:HD domain-containing protein [Bacillota bacterium]